MNSLPKDNLRYPVFIRLDSGSCGSGFFLNRNEEGAYLVTARHVLFAETPGHAMLGATAELNAYSNNLAVHEPVKLKLDLVRLQAEGNVRFDQVADVAMIKIWNQVEGRAIPVSGIQVLQGPSTGYSYLCVGKNATRSYVEVGESNDVYVFGYPISLGLQNMRQIDYERPLLRRGIVAGKNDATKTIIIDCPVYPGNSGGPVLEVADEEGEQRFKVIGVVSQFVPYTQEWHNRQLNVRNVSIENSGYSVVAPIDAVLELSKQFVVYVDVYRKIIALLNERGVEYATEHHEAVTTSEAASQVRGVSMHAGAKALVMRGKKTGQHWLFVMPADLRLDTRKAEALVGEKIGFAPEPEAVTGCVKGSVPPLGSVIGLKTYVDKRLAENVVIHFNAGSLTDSVSMKYVDYIAIEQPTIVDITE